MAENEKAQAADKTEYVEYLGEEPYGVTFLTSHTIPKGDPLWKRSRVEDAKNVTWERDPTGPGIGQKGARMLVPVADLTSGMISVLEKLPNYRRVSE